MVAFVKNIVLTVCVFLWELCIVINGYAQTNTRLTELEQKAKNATSDTAKVELYNTLYDEQVRTNIILAKRHADEALKIAQRIDYKKGVVESTERIAESFERQSAFPQALTYYAQALKLRQKLNQNRQVADLYNKIGKILVVQGNVKTAQENFQNALQYHEQANNAQGVLLTITYIGEAHFKEKDYERAITKFKEVINSPEKDKDRSVIAKCLYGLGEIFYLQKDYAEAEKYYQQFLKISINDKKIQDVFTGYEGVIKIADAQENHKKAFEFTQRYLQTVKEYSYSVEKNQQIVIGKSQHELEEEAKQRKKIEEQNAYITWLAYLAVVGIAVTLLMLFFVIRSYRNTHKINQRLASETAEREAQNKILEEQKAQIEAQNDAINRKNDAQEATFREIERKNKEITSSINYAKRIQESMLATDAKIADALPEHFVFFRPRDIVSGDFYWFAQRDNKIIIAALDCTGHGVPGAIMSMLGDSYLNQIIKLQGITDPEHILDKLHQNIGIALNQEETQNQDGMDIALCVIDKEKKTMEFAGASRPMLLIQDGKTQVIESCKLPVGGFQRDRERVFDKFSFDLTTPTWFYVFSDGFQDQFGGSKGRKFAKNRLEELLFELHPKPHSEQKKLLNKTLVDWMGDNRQMDDILIIGVKLHY